MIISRKSGFNLIEIAIVLAVIGLVIGGIYVAASAVTENNRKQTHQKQILQIVQNIRSVYATQPTYSPPTYAQIKALGIMPGDVTDTGTGFLNPYGGTIVLFTSAASYGALTPNQVIGIQTRVTKSACIDMLAKFFGNPASNVAMGLVEAGTSSGSTAGPSSGTGVTIATATTVCDQTGTNNSVDLYFSLR